MHACIHIPTPRKFFHIADLNSYFQARTGWPSNQRKSIYECGEAGGTRHIRDSGRWENSVCPSWIFVGAFWYICICVFVYAYCESLHMNAAKWGGARHIRDSGRWENSVCPSWIFVGAFCMYVCIYVCMYAWYVCICVCMHSIYAYVFVYTCIHTHTHTYITTIKTYIQTHTHTHREGRLGRTCCMYGNGLDVYWPGASIHVCMCKVTSILVTCCMYV
jgi:hypothetical protein